MFDFLDKVNETKKKEVQKLLLLLGGETGSGKSYVGAGTFPEEMKGCHITIAHEAHGYESAKKRCYHIPLHKQPQEDGSWDVLDASEQRDYLKDLLTGELSEKIAERFDYCVIDSGNLCTIFRQLGDYISSKYNKAEILDNMYAEFFQWCSDLRDKGLHVVVTMPYYFDGNNRYIPTIIGRTGIFMAGMWPYRLYVQRDSTGQAVWNCTGEIDKISKKQDGSSFVEKLQGTRLGTYPAEPLHGKKASIASLLKYIEHCEKTEDK